MSTRFLGVVAQVDLQPDATQLPGSNVLQNLTNGIGAWALVVCLAAFLAGAAVWAVGSNSQNFQWTQNGKRAVVVSVMGALLIGGAAAIINFFFDAGGAI